MSEVTIMDSEVDIVIGALCSDLTSFMNEWRPIFSRFHLIIVKDPDLKEELKIPEGFNINVYTKSHMERLLGTTSSSLFCGYSCRYFGFLVSRKKYIVSIDDDCMPAKDSNGFPIDAVAQHIINLSTPATPFFFNTLYDPYREGADFVRGYPFSLRSGVPCALSCGLWLNLADLDAPTQALKAGQRNSRYVDAVLTVPARAMMPISGINIAFDRELVGPALLPALKLAREGKLRWETMEDIWSGMCVKVVCDHLGHGVKSGLPYVWRNDRGSAIDSLKKEWEGVKLMEEVVPFFQSMRLSAAAATAMDCVVEMAAVVEERRTKINFKNNPKLAHSLSKPSGRRRMVFYFKARPEAGDYTIFMGLDKYENEELIKYGFLEDIWFHVDKMSSAHVYLRLHKGQTIDDISEGVLEDCAQLVKANSIQGNKVNNIDVVYTPWSNLKKTASMDVGQVGFHNSKMVRTVRVEKRINDIVNRLNRTKVERKPDFKAEKEAVNAAERAERKLQLRDKKRREEMERLEKERQAEIRSYKGLMVSENMTSNKEIAAANKSLQELEEDFM